MRRWIPFGFLAVLIALAARPLWSLPAFFYSDDGLLHLIRLAAFDRTLREGVVAPRWLFDLAYGYGYPILDFYPPLYAYLIEMIHLFGVHLADAMQIALVAIIALATFGAYALGVEWFGRVGGVLVAVAYIFFPYFLLNLYIRGALAEALAAALLPWLALTLRRVITRASLGAVLAGALTLALLVGTHGLTMLVAAPVLGGYVLFELARVVKPERIRALTRLSGAAMLGALLSAAYWLPFAAELSAVSMQVGAQDILKSWIYHALPVNRVVQSSLAFQYPNDAPFPLALAPMLFAACAAFLIFARVTMPARRMLIYFGVVTCVLVLALTTWASSAWQAIPLATMVQYPWRVSGVIGLTVALLIGSLATLFKPSLARIAIAFAISGLLIWGALAELAPPELGVPRDEITPAQIARYEVFTTFIGTTTWGEYLPNQVDATTLIYRHPITATARASSAHITLERDTATTRILRADSFEPFTLTLRAFYFPDWRATIDDQPATTFASTPLGLLTLRVPAGEHLIAFTLGGTLPRQLGTLVSLTALVAFIALGVRLRHETDARGALVGIALVGAILGIPNSVALAAQPTPTQSVHVRVAPSLDLIGMRVQETASTLRVQPVWRVRAPLAEQLVEWRIVDDTGRVWSEHTQLPRYGTGVAATWLADEIVRDEYALPIDALPGGRYALLVRANAARDFVRVSEVVLARAQHADTPAPQIEQRVDALFAQRIRLLGFNAPRVAHPGDRLPVTIFWQAERAIGDDFVAFVQLLDARGDAVAQYDSFPGGGLLPTFLWTPDKSVADYKPWRLPRDLEPGVYRLIAGWYRYPEVKRLPATTADGELPDGTVTLGEIKVPGTLAPRPAYSLDARIGNAIRLIGYDLNKSRSNVALTLHWQATGRVESDLTVFVHLVDAHGNLVAQHDQLPRAGNYPTRSWDAGEYIADAHALSIVSLAPGEYRLFVGMYDATTGARMPATDVGGRAFANHAIELTQFSISEP